MSFWKALLRFFAADHRQSNGESEINKIPIKIIDLTTDDYRLNYSLGAAGEQLPGRARELLALVLDARSWLVETNDWFDVDLQKNKCPQYPLIRELGEEIYRQGGIPAMWRAAAFVRERTGNAPPSRTLLNDMWMASANGLPNASNALEPGIQEQRWAFFLYAGTISKPRFPGEAALRSSARGHQRPPPPTNPCRNLTRISGPPPPQ